MSRMTRRTFNLGALASAAGGGLLAPGWLLRAARAQGGEALSASEIAPGVRVIMGRGGNALVAAGDGGALLIDCKVAGAGGALRALAEEGGTPLRAVINTHHHGDHTGGNPAFTPDLPVHAHRSCRPRVRAQVAARGETPDPYLPTDDLVEQAVVEAGGVRAELRHAGAGHTDNDVYVFFPEANVLHTGDLVFHMNHPYIDRGAGATTTGWMDSCRAMLELCDDGTVVAPGHGDVTDRSGIERQIAYFEAVREAVGEVVSAGGPREAAERIRLRMFANMGFERLRTQALGAVYDELVEAAR